MCLRLCCDRQERSDQTLIQGSYLSTGGNSPAEPAVITLYICHAYFNVIVSEYIIIYYVTYR